VKGVAIRLKPKKGGWVFSDVEDIPERVETGVRESNNARSSLLLSLIGGHALGQSATQKTEDTFISSINCLSKLYVEE